MTGLANVDGFKICIQVCMLPGFRPLTLGTSKEDMVFRCVF